MICLLGFCKLYKTCKYFLVKSLNYFLCMYNYEWCYRNKNDIKRFSAIYKIHKKRTKTNKNEQDTDLTITNINISKTMMYFYGLLITFFTILDALISHPFVRLYHIQIWFFSAKIIASFRKAKIYKRWISYFGFVYLFIFKKTCLLFFTLFWLIKESVFSLSIKLFFFL